MEQIDVHIYTLKSATPLNACSSAITHQGALLRITNNLGSGFSSVNPWPSLGDPSLQTLLKDLTRYKLGQQALYCATIDRHARLENRSLFKNLSIPDSHRTLSTLSKALLQESLELGFQTVKIKFGISWESESTLLQKLLPLFPNLRWRLDFNLQGSFPKLLSFFQNLPAEQKRQIDFLEDPFPPLGHNWSQFTQLTGIALAQDRAQGTSASVRIFKPALQRYPTPVSEKDHSINFITTSYMDHPLGQSYAAYCAAQHTPEAVCGLQTHHLFEPHLFSEELGPESPHFQPSQGTGLGFNSLLQAIPWKPLR